ncbi:hypothetical protein BAE44_0004093 [Dichanthelium oligosanthes]|uniref:ABC1 atypical kinase-like domain-containing protein n=1 Tax=Dichanthelium oligosanthes TaxID=888268 RepID=A0A1E5WCD8_9POAL|nr:hypothetical protein BAE44_0004093 [Dichanthelium oligosanthes]
MLMAMMVHDLSFSVSTPSAKLPRYEASKNDTLLVKTSPTFRAEVRPAETGKYVTNSQATKMVPTAELRRSNGAGLVRPGIVNGSANGAVNGSTKAVISGTPKVVVNGTSLVKGRKRSSLVETQKPMRLKDDHFQEELKILPSDDGFSWAKDNYSSMQRTIDIWSMLLSLRIRVLFDNAKWAYAGGFSEEKQDSVPAFSPEKAKTFIEMEMGCPIDAVFKEFEDRPMAAASLGQVHRAVLHNGERVAVKVQRPGLKQLFDIDLRNLKLVAEYFERSETFGGTSMGWIGIYMECSNLYGMVIIFIGTNAQNFIMWDYTTNKVLTMEYVPGIKINNLDVLDSQGYNRSLIASSATKSYLIQFLKTGFFHADPHPGNLAMDKDGSLIYYDFGMMGEIKSFTQERLISLFYSVYENDTNKVIKALIELEILQPTGDLSPVRRSIRFFLDNLLSQAPDKRQTLGAIGEELLDLKQNHRSGPEFVQEIRKQATDARDSTISMPYRIQRIENFVGKLESGDLKLRVRVLESERAARRANVLQMATMYTALSGTLLNIGVTLNSQGNQIIANGLFVGAGVFLALLIRSMQRAKKLDKIETMM